MKKSRGRSKDELQFQARVGNYLRDKRKEARLSQTEIARSLGVDQSAYSRMEAGIQNVTTFQLLVLCSVLHVEPERILSVVSA